MAEQRKSFGSGRPARAAPLRARAEHLRHGSAARQARHETIPELAGQGLRLGAEARDIERDAGLEIDEAVLAHLEADRVRLAVERVVHLLPVEQRTDHADVFAERARGAWACVPACAWRCVRSRAR